MSPLTPVPTEAARPAATPSHPWFTEYILPHEEALRRWVRARFPNLDADDVCQETLYRVFRAHSNQVVIAHPKQYLFQTARNFALNSIRHDRHENRDALGEADPSAVPDDKPSIPESIARSQEHDLLAEAIHLLPERARQVITLRRVYHRSIKEIAAELNISTNTVEIHLTLAIRRCTEYVKEADLRAARASQFSRPAFAPRSLRHV